MKTIYMSVPISALSCEPAALLSFQPKMCASVLQLAFHDLVKFKQTKPPGFSMYYRKSVNQAEYIFPSHSCRNPQD